MQGRTLIIRWGLNEGFLLHYLVAFNNDVIRDGHLITGISDDEALKVLKKIIQKNKIDKLIVENNAFLNTIRVATDGHNITETGLWGKKLRSVDRIYQKIISGEIQIPFEVKNFYTSNEMYKCKHGKFLGLNVDGTVKFEREKIRLPKSLMNFSSYIYESIMLPGISFVWPAKMMIKTGDGKLEVQLGSTKIILDTNLKFKDGYVALWIRKNKSGFDAVLSYGKTYRQAMNMHRKSVIREMVKWINETKEVGFVLGLSRVSHTQAPEYALKYMEKQLN